VEVPLANQPSVLRLRKVVIVASGRACRLDKRSVDTMQVMAKVVRYVAATSQGVARTAVETAAAQASASGSPLSPIVVGDVLGAAWKGRRAATISEGSW